jgi:hypothetical protein
VLQELVTTGHLYKICCEELKKDNEITPDGFSEFLPFLKKAFLNYNI